MYSPENHRTKWKFIAGKKSSIATLDYQSNLSDRQLPGTISSGKPTPPPQTYSTTTTITMTIISSIRLDEMKVKVNMKNMMLALVLLMNQYESLSIAFCTTINHS